MANCRTKAPRSNKPKGLGLRALASKERPTLPSLCAYEIDGVNWTYGGVCLPRRRRERACFFARRGCQFFGGSAPEDGGSRAVCLFRRPAKQPLVRTAAPA